MRWRRQAAGGRAAKAESAGLRAELGEVRGKLAAAARQVEGEQAASRALAQQVAQLKQEYSLVGDQLESEQTRIQQARPHTWLQFCI